MARTEAFDIYISGTWRLPLDHIWPDGDAPENPTVEDVRALFPWDGDPAALIREWNLIPEVDVRAV